jgi:hypothetical protein
MDMDKLLEAIQILIKEELKEQLPALIKEGVKAEMKKMLSEGKVAPKPQSKGISMAKAILGDEPIQESVQPKQAPTKQFSKNPMINQILNETAMAPSTGDGYRTMSFGQGDMGSIVGRTAIAEKMGYGDLAKGPSPTGLGVNTGVAEIDKALNRDYSELVKRFKKK